MSLNYQKIRASLLEQFRNEQNLTSFRKIHKSKKDTSKVNYLITGGCGLIGNALAKELSLSENNIVTVCDIIPKNFKKLENVLYLDLDLSTVFDSHQLDLSQFDYVYHLASDNGKHNFYEFPSPSFINNYLIDKHFIELLTSRFLKNPPKVIFASASEVYGELKDAKESDNFSIMNAPRGSFACEKLMFEFLLKNFNIPHVIARIFNVYGKDFARNKHSIDTFIERAKNNKDIELYNKDAIRCFCDVNSCVKQLIAIKDEVGEFNVGSEEKTTIDDLLKKVLCEYNSKSKIVETEQEQCIKVLTPNLSKIKNFL